MLPFIKTSCISSRMFLIWVTLHSCLTLSRYIKLATRITHHVLAWGTTCICVYTEAGFSVRYLSPPLPTLDVEVGSQLIQNITYKLVKLSSMSWHSPVCTSKMIRYIWSTILAFTQTLRIWSQAFLFGWQMLHPLSHLTSYEVHISFSWNPDYLQASLFFHSAFDSSLTCELDLYSKPEIASLGL